MSKLEELKVGDLVIVGRGYASDVVAKIDRVTKSQLIVNNRNFWKKNGRVVGGDPWCCDRIIIATEENLCNLKRLKRMKELIAYLRDVSWSKYPLESLELFVEVLKAETRQ